jgi:hypothetical protein
MICCFNGIFYKVIIYIVALLINGDLVCLFVFANYMEFISFAEYLMWPDGEDGWNSEGGVQPDSCTRVSMRASWAMCKTFYTNESSYNLSLCLISRGVFDWIFKFYQWFYFVGLQFQQSIVSAQRFLVKFIKNNLLYSQFTTHLKFGCTFVWWNHTNLVRPQTTQNFVWLPY